MALHPSLLELAEAAPRCESLAAARGVLAEAQDLLRNALQHREDELALAAWYSRLVADIIHSPAINSAVRLTGAHFRGDGIPSIPVSYLGHDDALAELFDSAGLAHAEAEDILPRRVDAGLPVGAGGEEILLDDALAKRPPAVHMIDGLPDRDAEVNILYGLLAPIAALARWAAPAPRPTPDRLAIGAERDLLTEEEVTSLTQAWVTGLRIELQRWLDHVHDHPATLADLSPMERTAYGSACRTVSEVLAAVAARENRSDNRI